MQHLSPADLIVIHEALLAEFGGMRGITEVGFGRLEGAAAAPQLSVFGDEVFPDLPSKAAALCHAITRAHPFSDGNKRVALVAMDVLLSLNGYALTATNDEAFATMMAAARGTMGRDELIAWLQSNIRENDGRCES